MINSSGGNVGNAGNTYPSLQDQCHQAITAAQKASSFGTTVYSIAYGAGSSGCNTDSTANGSSTISPCATMQQMSSGYVSTSNMPHFYSDSSTKTNSGQCTSQYNLNLQGIFGSITSQLSKARLIPNNVT